MSVLAEKTRLYQAALEERRRRWTNLDESWSLEAERAVGCVEHEVIEAHREMEIAWLEVAHAGR